MKPWLATLVEQPSQAVLQVVDMNLDDRMRSQHDVGEERRKAHQKGGCGSRTGANGDRTENVDFGRDASGAVDQADGMDLQAPRARSGRS